VRRWRGQEAEAIGQIELATATKPIQAYPSLYKPVQANLGQPSHWSLNLLHELLLGLEVPEWRHGHAIGNWGHANSPELQRDAVIIPVLPPVKNALSRPEVSSVWTLQGGSSDIDVASPVTGRLSVL
jgi:hypothetical protein